MSGSKAGRKFFKAGIGLALTASLVAALVTTSAAASAATSAATVSVDDNVTTGSNSFAYTGSSWTNCGNCNSAAYQGSYHYGYATADKVTFTFNGTQAKVYGFKEPAGGIATVSVDGGASVDVNYYAAKQTLTNVYSSPVLASGQHKVTFTVSGRKTSGTSPTINIDRADVMTGQTTPPPTSTPPTTPPTTPPPPPPPTGAATIDDSVTTGSNSFAYTGSSWTNCGNCNSAAYQGSYHYGYATADKVTFTFNGTQAKVYGFKEPAGGIAIVSVDGGASVDVNYYAAKQTLTNVYSSPVLASGQHKVTFTVSGRKTSGTSPTINIDRADVMTGQTTPPPTSTPPTTPPPTTTPPTTTPPPTSTPPTSTPPPTSGRWLSGGGGQGDLIANGSVAAWRGDPLDVVTTWSDNSAVNAENMWQFTAASGELRNWGGDVDIAVGAIWSGNTWAQAASGGMDATWSAILNKGKQVMTGNRADNVMYIRFAHEMNGNWYTHSVKAADIANFKAAWIRFYNLKQAIFPQAKLVFGTNGNTSGQSYDWRSLWPGDRYVDVYSTDWYSNHWKMSGNSTGVKVDSYGAPVGLESHRAFAQAHGVPLAISEWGDNWNETGDSPAYIQDMHNFFVANGGTGAGKVLYEDLFNNIQGDHQFDLFPKSASKSPLASAKYAELW